MAGVGSATAAAGVSFSRLMSSASLSSASESAGRSLVLVVVVVSGAPALALVGDWSSLVVRSTVAGALLVALGGGSCCGVGRWESLRTVGAIAALEGCSPAGAGASA